MAFCDMSLMQKSSLFPMVGLKSKIFAFIADNFTVEVLLQNLWTILYFGADFIISIKIAEFSSFSFLIVSTTCTCTPYKFLIISKLLRTMYVVSVVAATPMRRTNQVLAGRIRTPQDESDLLMTNQNP